MYQPQTLPQQPQNQTWLHWQQILQQAQNASHQPQQPLIQLQNLQQLANLVPLSHDLDGSKIRFDLLNQSASQFQPQKIIRLKELQTNPYMNSGLPVVVQSQTPTAQFKSNSVEQLLQLQQVYQRCVDQSLVDKQNSQLSSMGSLLHPTSSHVLGIPDINSFQGISGASGLSTMNDTATMAGLSGALPGLLAKKNLDFIQLNGLTHLTSSPEITPLANFGPEVPLDKQQRFNIGLRKSKCCTRSGCTKAAQGGTKFCVAHGGGKRCQLQGCTTGARGRTKFCTKHGGGRRCYVKNCSKSAIGSTKFCVKHGGGKRCQTADCGKAAQGATDYCVRHGGGRKCEALGCWLEAKSRSRHCPFH